jgi:hypothetical protein
MGHGGGLSLVCNFVAQDAVQQRRCSRLFPQSQPPCDTNKHAACILFPPSPHDSSSTWAPLNAMLELDYVRPHPSMCRSGRWRVALTRAGWLLGTCGRTWRRVELELLTTAGGAAWRRTAGSRTRGRHALLRG